MIKKLRIKFILIIMIFVTSILAVVLGSLYVSNMKRFERDSHNTMTMAAENWKAKNSHDRSSVGRRRDSQMPPAFMPFFIVTLIDGETVSEIWQTSTTVTTVEATTLSKLVLASEVTEGKLKDYTLRYLKTNTPDGIQIVFLDESFELNFLRTLLFNCLTIFLIGSLAFFILGLWLSKWALKPAEQAWEQQNQFIADASHELKTPLTVILANLQILSSHKDETIKSQEKWLSNTKDETTRMKQLVDELLFLARSDAGSGDMAQDEFDLSDAVWSCILPFESIAFEQKVTMETTIEPGISIVGNKGQMKQLAVILLDNACKYAGQHGTVWVQLTKGQSHISLTVKNSGEPIAEADLEHIFERFYRTDKSRVRKEGGYGLGLAIARTIVQQHGGKISVTSSAEDGTTFTVKLGCTASLVSGS